MVINTTAAAFSLGLITSMHCVLMCGPLVCGIASLREGSRKLVYAATLYQSVRIGMYVLIGALLGGFGERVQPLLNSEYAHMLPWLLVGILCVVGFGLERYIPQPVFFSRFVSRIQRRLMPENLYARYGLAGALTPFLPCGPLYMIFGVCLFVGSAVQGASFMLAFGLGTMPLLLLVHLQWMALSRRWLTKHMGLVRKGAALTMALFISVRLLSDMSIQPNDGTPEEAQQATEACPMCQ